MPQSPGQKDEGFPFRHNCVPNPRLRVMLRDGDGRQFLHQLVHAHAALSGERLQLRVRIVGETDGPLWHGSALDRSVRSDWKSRISCVPSKDVTERVPQGNSLGKWPHIVWRSVAGCNTIAS